MQQAIRIVREMNWPLTRAMALTELTPYLSYCQLLEVRQTFEWQKLGWVWAHSQALYGIALRMAELERPQECLEIVQQIEEKIWLVDTLKGILKFLPSESMQDVVKRQLERDIDDN